ncbi:MAG TPA: hypothetical protein ENK75_06920 [Saprospiraceae bacterium]|nr:hypothetical protein [Saprospiraceae bacterium]
MTNKQWEWDTYFENISKQFTNNLVLLFIGVIFYILWYVWGFDTLLSFEYLHITIGHIGYLGLLFTPAFLIFHNQRYKNLWIFFSTITLLDLQNMMYITNNESYIIGNVLFNSIMLSMLILIFIVAIVFDIFKDLYDTNWKTTRQELGGVVCSSLFFIIVYHGVNIFLKEVPNEERSCYLGSLECHHINYGIVLLVFIPLVFKYVSKQSSRKLKFLGLMYIGFVYGTVFDESFYYMLQDVNDKSYFDFSVTSFSLLIMLIALLIWFYNLRKENNNVT